MRVHGGQRGEAKWHFRHPEVGDLDHVAPVGGAHQVLQLQVPVRDSLAVAVLDAVEDLQEVPPCLGELETVIGL